MVPSFSMLGTHTFTCYLLFNKKRFSLTLLLELAFGLQDVVQSYNSPDAGTGSCLPNRGHRTR
jgi:hypothetical protein